MGWVGKRFRIATHISQDSSRRLENYRFSLKKICPNKGIGLIGFCYVLSRLVPDLTKLCLPMVSFKSRTSNCDEQLYGLHW